MGSKSSSWHLSLYLCLALFASCADIALAAISIPEDASFPTPGYRQLGIPDPGRDWTASEYEAALDVLAELQPSQLPRLGSSRSGPVFERLLSTYENELELAPGQHLERVGAPPPSLAKLYSPESFLFDRESVAIQAAALRRSLSHLPTRSQSFELAERLTRRITSGTEADTARLREQLQQVRVNAENSALLVRQQAVELVALGAIPELTQVARRDLVQHVEQLVPKLNDYLGPPDLLWIADVLRGAASLEANSALRSTLLSCAARLTGSAKALEDLESR